MAKKPPKLPKYTLTKDDKKKDWVLQEDGANRATRRFGTKKEATARGVLKKAIGAGGGSVKIQKEDGKYEEERTFPRDKDPRSSPG